MTAKSVTYVIEQKFPSSKYGPLQWYESGAEYAKKKEALDRLKELMGNKHFFPMLKEKNFRIVKKTVIVEIIQNI